MKIQAVDSQNFQSGRDRGLSYNYNADRKNPRANIDAVISLDDNSIRNIAMAKTMATVDDDKHRKISRAMFYSIPVVAGIAASVLSPASSKFLSKELTGVSGKLLNGAKTAGLWAAVIAGVELISGTKGLIEKKSPEFKQANRENPILSFVGTAAAFLGLMSLGGKYLPKAAEKMLKHVKPESVEKFANGVLTKGNKFNNASFVKTMNKWTNELSGKKYLDPLKEIGKTALSWAPSLLLWGGVFHSINHNFVRNREFVNNYSNMKDSQARLAKARLRELSMQNVSLKQDVAACHNAKANAELSETISAIQVKKAECPDCV